MGHRKNAKTRDLNQQAYDRWNKMLAFGHSKRADRNNDPEFVANRIYSYSTYQTYKKHTKYFLRWIRENHPEVRKLTQAKKYVAEWLQLRTDEGLSAWTIQTEAAALNKLYGIRVDDPKRFQPLKRRKEDIVRSRGTKVRDIHFSEAKNEELVNFCKGCGFRRNVLEKLRGSDLMDRAQVSATYTAAQEKGDTAMVKACKDALQTFPDQDYYIIHRKDKGGKTRISPIVGPHKAKIVERMKNTAPDERVWQYVNKNCDVHSYRADYATYLYKLYARPIEELHYDRKILCADGKYRSEIYICRGDERGKRLDRRAVGVISIALGHNREDTAITNYIRNL